MSLCTLMATADKYLRPALNGISPKFAVRVYSPGRKIFLKMLANESLDGRRVVPEKYRRTLWGIDFYSPLMNSAGMFKHGEGYETAFRQGAGAYLCGTSTDKPRPGNAKFGVKTPFISYPYSGASSNWMGLPNFGHDDLATRIQKIEKHSLCPIGVSLSPQPDAESLEDSAAGVVRGLNIFDKTQADFAEINESCPNVPHDVACGAKNAPDANMVARLEIISREFLKKRNRNFPVIVKFSNDTDPMLVPQLLECLVSLGFDGVNFGNTSTDYDKLHPLFEEQDLPALDYFIKNFGGGVSGKVLRHKSYELCYTALANLKTMNVPQEFRVVRTGGVAEYSDIEKSEHVGVDLNQWFTGYFEAFAQYGHELYTQILK